MRKATVSVIVTIIFNDIPIYYALEYDKTDYEQIAQALIDLYYDNYLV